MQQTTEEPFAAFWNAYPRRIGKKDAFRAYVKAINDGTTPEEIIAGVEAYKADIIQKQTDESFVAHPSTWLNQGRWMDVHGLNLPKVESLSREESTRLARTAGFFKTGFWKDEWGDRPKEVNLRLVG